MVENITGIAINVIMVIIILLVVVAAVIFENQLKSCETTQSTFCYTIHCPGEESQAPCYGYSKIPGSKPNTWVCSSAPALLVDNSGNVVS